MNPILPYGGRRLPMAAVPRLVDPEWKCQRSGDCCTIPLEVVMTKDEAAVITHHAPPGIRLAFRPIDERFVALKTGPCPLYAFKTCLVYHHRPFNCRRFACMRPDVKAEPFEVSGANMMERVRISRIALRMAKRIQHRAQIWAYAHGWPKDESDGTGG